jgi:hypothetical protein
MDIGFMPMNSALSSIGSSARQESFECVGRHIASTPMKE